MLPSAVHINIYFNMYNDRITTESLSQAFSLIFLITKRLSRFNENESDWQRKNVSTILQFEA